MPTFMRIAFAVLLFVVAGACVFLTVAAREAPREFWWALWTIYAVAGLASVTGALRLLWTMRNCVELHTGR